MNRSRQIAVAIIVLCAMICGDALPQPSSQGGPPQIPAFANWTLHEDFTHGIPGWTSFPLSQDVGYDPTIYTAQVGGTAALVRNRTSYGERLLRVGMARPIKFHFAPSSSFRIGYTFESGGRIMGLHLTLGALNGQRYTHSLSLQPGLHDIQVDGRQLEIPPAGVDVEVIVVEAEVAAPPLASHSLLTLRSLEIQAERPAAIAISVPPIDRSAADGTAVAEEVVNAGSTLKVELARGTEAQVRVYDNQGGLVPIKAGKGQDTQIVAPEKPGIYKAQITSGHSMSEFDFLTLGKVPAHPRVLLTSDRLEQLKSQPYSKALLADVHKRATGLRDALAYNPQAGRNIALLPVASPHPGLVEYFALMDSYSNAIAFNGLDYQLSGDPQSLEAARRALLTVAAWTTWTPPWFIANGLHTYYEVGVFTQRVALGYDLVSDRLSQEDKSQIAEALWKNSIRPTVDDYFTYNRLPVAASNHESQSVGGAIEACVALYGDVPDWTTKFGPALAKLIVAYGRMDEGLFPGDGSEAEPAGYEHFAMEGMSWGMAALQAMGIRPRGFDRMMNGYGWLRDVQVRPGFVLDTGDTGTELQALSGFAWGAEFGGDRALQAFYETATNQRLQGVFELHQLGQTKEQGSGLLDLVCCTHPSGVEPEPPLSRIFPARGSAVMRSGWLPQDTVISLRAGPWFNHEHHDQGSFQVAAFGEQLIAEAGYANYYKDPHYEDYFTQAPGHNTVVIDGDPFSQQDYDGRYWAAFENYSKIERHVFSSAIDYLAANLAPAYGDGNPINRLTREYLFVKPDVLIVHDRVAADSPHEYSWFLHVPAGAQARADAAEALIQGKGALAAITAAGPNTHWKLQTQPVAISAYIDLDRIPVEPRKTFLLDSSRAKEASFLVAMHFQKGSGPAAPLTPVQTSSGEGFRTSGANSSTVVLFRRSVGSLTAGEISTDGTNLVVIEKDGVEEILSAQVRSLRRGQQTLLSATSAVEVVLDKSPSYDDVHLVCASETEVKLFLKKQPVDVMVDQAHTTPTLAGGSISLAHLAKGEHVVRISY